METLLFDNFSIQPQDADGKAQVGEDEDVMSQEWKLPSTGIKSMDDEHKKCEEAMFRLLSKPDEISLTSCMELLTEHFQHEESLMKKCGFGKPSEQFSSYANHVKDHERILDIGFRELGKLSRQSEALDRSFLATTVSDESGCSSGNSTTWHMPATKVVKVDKTIAESIVREFRLHATRFDVLYEGHIEDVSK